MKRVQEKIKDLVDVRTYETVKNYASDVAATVGAYHFTDATSDLMAKWLDEIVELAYRRTGAARALAGNRGVGKSHFLSVLGALAAHPELRTRVSDAHVGLSAQRLPRQKHLVVSVERGLCETLTEELQMALNKAFGANAVPWGDSPAQMLSIAAAQTGELPLVVLIDSAYERKARVKRDDGALLGEMAETAQQAKIFLAIALDDDIAGADGVNAAITRTCTIDYLDQEHLYRIVDAFLFQKRANARPILRELYQGLREATPGFNWSEPRFASLYPFHPVVVDIAPAVRLYAPKFAFLPFVAENAAKVLSRPAHSLLALDEVFDRIEPELRKAVELDETFVVYDELAANAISQIPIMQRLQAKLILKGLLLMSLDGRGATARELGAAMLIYDESQPLVAVQKIEETIQFFANVVTESQLRRTVVEDETRYSLGNSVSATFEAKLAEAAQTVDASAIGRVMRRIGQARFSDWVFSDLNLNDSKSVAEFSVQWRGSVRRGRLIWTWGLEQAFNPPSKNENYDWQIYLTAPNEIIDADKAAALNLETTIFWQPDALRRDEEEMVRRYTALLTNAELIEEFGDTASAAEQVTAAHLERVWTRIFVDEGKLLLNHEEIVFSAEAKAFHNLVESLRNALTPVFDRRFPDHPDFTEQLTTTEVSQIVSDLFGGANVLAPATQKLAETFAAPLKLVVTRGSHLVLETDENLLKLPLISRILEMTGAANGAGVSLDEIHRTLRAAPDGLSREAQNLLLAALVARRRLEFVTTTNNRITHRSLDLRIIWSDVIGVAQSSVQPRASAELAQWANLLLEKTDFATIDELAERERMLQALGDWLSQWQTNRVLERFEELPDETLNVRAWRTVAQVERTFGEVAEAVEAVLTKEVSLEEGLERVIDAFGDSPANMSESRLQLAELKTFIEAAWLRQNVWRYLARVEATTSETIENLRRDLLDELLVVENSFDDHASQMFERMWHEFKHLYTEFYIERHNAVMHSSLPAQTLQEIEQTAEWQEFVELTNLPFAPWHYFETAERLRREIKSTKCNFDPRQILQTQPLCACGWRLSQASNAERLPQELEQTIAQGRTTFRRTLTALAAPLATALNEVSQIEVNASFADRAKQFAEELKQGADLPVLTAIDLRLLSQAVNQMPQSVVKVRSPRGTGALPKEELRLRLNSWLDNLPNSPVLVKLAED